MYVLALDQDELVFFGGTFNRPAVVLVLERVPSRHGANLFAAIPQQFLLFHTVFAVVRDLHDRTALGELHVVVSSVGLRVIATIVIAQLNGVPEGRGHADAGDLV
jgi:hypothetical protein